MRAQTILFCIVIRLNLIRFDTFYCPLAQLMEPLIFFCITNPFKKKPRENEIDTNGSIKRLNTFYKIAINSVNVHPFFYAILCLSIYAVLSGACIRLFLSSLFSRWISGHTLLCQPFNQPSVSILNTSNEP